jgi:hypothetical protein
VLGRSVYGWLPGKPAGFTILDTPFPFVLFLLQPKTEVLLRDNVVELGVPVPAPAPSAFGLLRQVRFVLLDVTGGRLGAPLRQFGPALDVVHASAMVTAGRPEWRGVKAVLLRPDGHIGWVGPDASTESAENLRRALAGWLDAIPAREFGSSAHCQGCGLPSRA